MMKANKQLGLPKWPKLYINEKSGECYISEKHPTYRRVQFGKFVQNLLFILIGIGLPLLINFNDHARSQADWDIATALGISFMMWIFFSLPICLFTPKVLATHFFPKKTSVRFVRDYISINGKKHTISPEFPIQFRASRPFVDEGTHIRLGQEAYGRERNKYAEYKLKFRRVEMIRGASIEQIAVIADQSRAEQFAAVLQAALLWNKNVAELLGRGTTENSSKRKRHTLTSDREDYLPE